MATITKTVILRDPQGERVVLRKGDPLPAWAADPDQPGGTIRRGDVVDDPAALKAASTRSRTPRRRDRQQRAAADAASADTPQADDGGGSDEATADAATPPDSDTDSDADSDRDAPPPKSGAGSGRAEWASYAGDLGLRVTDDMTREDIIHAVEEVTGS